MITSLGFLVFVRERPAALGFCETHTQNDICQKLVTVLKTEQQGIFRSL